jgi:hypothetical protein
MPVSRRFTQFLRAAAASVVLAAGLQSPASAILISGAWDPVYGAPFDTAPDVLGWRGNATFEIPDACVAAGLVTSSSCAGMKLDSAQVTFYDVLGGGTTLETFNYTSADLNKFAVSFDAAGNILSLTSDFFAPRFPTSEFAEIDDYAFLLHFVAGGVQMYHSLDADLGKIDLFIPPKLCLAGIPGFVCGYSGTNSGGGEPPAPVAITFVRVPEPVSMALLLAAGLAAVVAGWRRPARRRATAWVSQRP